MNRALLILAILFLATPSSAKAFELRGVVRNNDGVKKLEAGRRVEAYDRFTDALADVPFSSEVHYNLGNSFLDNKEVDKALSEYRQAIKLAPGESSREKDLRFKAHFNSAIALTEQKKIDEALAQYQQALELEPESVETKTNIELLIQSGQGGGEGDQSQQDKGDQKKDKQGQGGEGQEQKPQQPQQSQQQNQQPKAKPSPRPFKSDEISQQDVGRILEELKRQEEQIRAKMQREGAKDAPRDKDW
jgi:tetratricopeptide (TPR) repeat protein